MRRGAQEGRAKWSMAGAPLPCALVAQTAPRPQMGPFAELILPRDSDDTILGPTKKRRRRGKTSLSRRAYERERTADAERPNACADHAQWRESQGHAQPRRNAAPP